MDYGGLEEQSKMVDEAIAALSDRIRSLRTPHLSDGTYDASTLSRKCSVICEVLQQTPNALECLKRCVRPVVPIRSVHSFEKEYPYDVRILDDDIGLLKAFERHQLAASDDMIPDTEEELNWITQIYTMPIATVVLPEVAWQRSLSLLQLPKHRAHQEKVLATWSRRKPNYPEKAWVELERKMKRHENAEDV